MAPHEDPSAGPPSENLRLATRALIVDPDDRVLLVRFELPTRTFHAMPGGGIEAGETDHEALRRELHEEVGLTDPRIGSLIWVRTHRFRMGAYDGQTERIYLVRADRFEPRPALTVEQLRREGVTEVRWHTLDELVRGNAQFAPTRLPSLVAGLFADGPPRTPLDVGV